MNELSDNPLWRRRRALPLLLGCALLTACATAKRDPGEPEGPTLAGAAHQYSTRITTRKTAPSETDERFRLYPGTGVVVRDPPPASVKQGGGNVTFNFEGADVREVVRTVLGDILKENYIVDPRVGGTITLRTAKPIPKASALVTLEEVLRMNGSVILREADGVLRIVPTDLAGRGNLTPQINAVGRALPDGYSIQIVPLEFIGVADMAKILEPLVGDGSTMRADPIRNLLYLAGTQLQLQHLLDTVRMFDVDWISGMSVGLFTLKNIDAKVVFGELEKIFGDKTLGPLAGAVRVVPIERLNALLVVTRQAKYLDQARVWVERIDQAGPGGGGTRLYVYPLQNGKAEQIADLLNNAFGKQGTAKKETPPSLAPGLVPAEVRSAEKRDDGKPAATVPDAKVSVAVPIAVALGEGLAVPQNIKVIADKDNNALLILAAAADYEVIEAAVKKLDVLPRQVLVEVTIAEVTLKDELKYGLEWYFKNGPGITGQLDVGRAGVAALVPGFSYSWVSKAGDMSAVLNALATDSKLKVISAPHVTVADNQTAKIQVGDRVPTISQTQSVNATTTATGIISTVQYIETGVLLNVKPRINSGGLVSMEINQEVSNAIPTTTSGIDSPTIQRRTAESVVTVQSGDTLVLAGLIREEKNRSAEGLPVLSRIPLLGGLFGNEAHSDNRTELIILITPRVLATVRDAAQVTEEYRRRLTGLEEMIRELAHERAAAAPVAPTERGGAR